MPMKPKKICKQHTGTENRPVNMVINCGKIKWWNTGEKGPLAISRPVLPLAWVALEEIVQKPEGIVLNTLPVPTTC